MSKNLALFDHVLNAKQYIILKQCLENNKECTKLIAEHVEWYLKDPKNIGIIDMIQCELVQIPNKIINALIFGTI